jgi:hypothetical protein
LLEDNYLHYCPHVSFPLIQISISLGVRNWR